MEDCFDCPPELWFSRETRPIDRQADRRTDNEELSHMVMKAEEFHNVTSASW